MPNPLPFRKEDAIKVPILSVKQPIGTFYIATIGAKDAADICSAEWRHADFDTRDELEEYIGIQRPLNKKRIEEIKKYVKTWDATFPNSIILAVRPDYYFIESESTMYIKRDSHSTNIIDGQHRLAGFDSESGNDFQLIVALFPELELEEQAYIFSVVNTKMTRINPSLSQDLYAFATLDTPEKLAHNIARDFNRDIANPWYDKIKMLGHRDAGSSAVLSQSTFTREIIAYIYNPKRAYEIRDFLHRTTNNRSTLSTFYSENEAERFIFWKPYVDGKDKYIYSVLKNYFAAVKEVYSQEWDDAHQILTKTTGYSALMHVLVNVYRLGLSKKDLSQDFFVSLFVKAKSSNKVKNFISTNYNPGKVGEKKLSDDFLNGMELINENET